MEEVLKPYETPYNIDYPVIFRDEQPVQLHKEIRTLIPATKKHARRVNYEYERAGTACIFMFNEPLGRLARGNRTRTSDEERRGLGDEKLLTVHYLDAKKIILVCDNLNTPMKGAFYEAFPPEKARSLVKRIEFRYTPKHGSWLNIAENELSSMTRQCLSFYHTLGPQNRDRNQLSIEMLGRWLR